MIAQPRLGSCVLPPLNPELDGLWDAILDLAEDLSPRGWVLVGGQMVILHGLAARRVATRASNDIDLLADLITARGAVGECVRAVRRLGFEPVEANGRWLLHRFVPGDQAVVDVPVPSPLGALMLKAAAYRADNRDRDRHAYDAAFLSSLITDPLAARDSFKSSDRKRLRALDEVLADRGHDAWRALGDQAEDGFARWRQLTS